MIDKSRISPAVCFLFFGPFLSFSQAQELPPEIVSYADMVLYNGQVLTMDRPSWRRFMLPSARCPWSASSPTARSATTASTPTPGC